jgi:hypothetical protein
MSSFGPARHPRRFLEVLGLAGAAVAQPIFSVFGSSPEVFVAADARPVDIVTFALVVLLVPPLVLWGAGALVGLAAPRARDAFHQATVGFLAGLLAVYAARHFGAPPVVAVGAGVVTTTGAVWLVRARPTVEEMLRYLAVGPVLFLVSFLVLSPVGALLLPENAGAAAVDVRRPGDLPPVVMIVFDEWPLTSIVGTDGEIDADLYPNLAELAGDSTWFRNTTTVTNATLQAVPALLTGRFPAAGQTATARSHPENLFTLLGGVYDVEAVEPMTALCPTAICDGSSLARVSGGDEAEPPVRSLVVDAGRIYGEMLSGAGGEADTAVGEVSAAADRVESAGRDDREAATDAITRPRPAGLAGLLGTIHPGEAPTVHFLHLLLPHAPYLALPNGDRYPQGPFRWDTHRGVRGGDQPSADFDRHRMLLQVGYIDSLVGDLIGRLRRAGLYDDALVVVTADHGVTFEAGATARGLGDEPLEADTMHDMAWVPLIVKAPGQSVGRVDDRNALTVDVLPTVADLAGVDVPWPVDGRSLTGPPRGDDHKPFIRQVGLSGGDYRLEPAGSVETSADLADVFAAGVDTVLEPGGGGGRWYRFGPRPELIGLRVSDMRQGPPSRMGPARLDTGSVIHVIAERDLPAMATGRVANPADDAVVAVAVDDRIAAVVPLYADNGGPGRVAAMLLRSTLTAGEHQVRLFEVAGRSSPQLRPIRVT